MTDVVLIHTSGGLIGDALLADLREEKTGRDTRFMAEVAGFTSLDGQAPTRGQHENDIEATFRTGVALWASFADELADGMDTGRLRDRLLRPLFDMLGFDLQYQRGHLRVGGDTYAISHLGWAGDDAPPVHLVAEPLDERRGGRRSPHEEVQRYLNASPQRWGVVTNGTSLRLLRDFHHTTTQGFVEFELASIFEAGSFSDFLALYRCCHASRFRPAHQPDTTAAAVTDVDGAEEDTDDDEAAVEAAEPQPLLEILYERSLSAGVAAGKRLQPQVRHAVEALANGLLDGNADIRQRMRDEAPFGRELYREILTFLYRTLFLLYAEQREMLRGANDLYDETYSITRLRQVAEEGGVEGRRGDLWEGLKATFAAFYDEDQAAALGVYPYNGQLFDPGRTATLQRAACPNHRVIEAVRALTTMRVGKVPVHVDYRNLGVEELGTVYESLLDYTLRIAAEPTASDDRKVLPGQAYLAPLSTERADLASYYTPPKLVDLTLARSLDPLIAERLEAAGEDREARQAAMLALRVIDPACGSGAFLVGALDRIAVALARERNAPAEPRDRDVAQARRDVLQHCIYGADKDPFAVELAKVALWIHCVVPDQPLSFLDHHIVCGDSLVGWPMFDLPREIRTEAYEFSKASGDDKKVLASARDENKVYVAGVRTLFDEAPDPEPRLRLPALLSHDEHSLADVRAKANAYGQYLASEEYQEKDVAANLWTAAFFWSAASGAAPTSRDYHKALRGDIGADLNEEVASVVAALNPLHWALAFPGVRDTGGFDLVIGNPPWEQFQSDPLEFFAVEAPEIALLPTKPRDEAIGRLRDEDPGLHARWTRYQAAQDRLAHFAKTSGRYERTPGKVNTYVLFSDMTPKLLNEAGWAGVLAKAGLVLDATQSTVFKAIRKDARLREWRDVINRAPGQPQRIFPGVKDPERFGVFILGPRRDDATAQFSASTLNLNLDEFEAREGASWSEVDIHALCPETQTLPSPRYEWELDLLRELHESVPLLAFATGEGENPWDMDTHNLYMSNTGQRFFRRDTELFEAGFVLGADKVFRRDGEEWLPVFEGQMTSAWDHRAKTYEGYSGPNKYGKKPAIPSVTDSQHADPSFEAEPRYWIAGERARLRLEKTVGDKAIIIFRDAAGFIFSNRRSMRAALLYRTVSTHVSPVISCPRESVLPLLAILNSHTFDFVARCHMSGSHLQPWVLSQCPAPLPRSVPARCSEIAAVLSATSTRVADAYELPLQVWNASERESLQVEVDSLVAKAYGLGRDDYERVLDHFVHQARQEVAVYGEYRTKRLCLEAFDRVEAGVHATAG